MRHVIALSFLFAIIVASGWYLVQEWPLAQEWYRARHAPVTVEQKLIVPAGKISDWSFSAPADKLPGTLIGQWTCKGSSGGIQDATDDTIVNYTLRNPENRVIDQGSHQVSGNFKIHFDGPGIYTFSFVNGGIVRTSARLITINAVYQRD